MSNIIKSTEIYSESDYKKVEVLGLLPTDRDPSAWLRMVARVFAAYKGVDITKTVSAYIDGFHILNDINDIKNHNPGYYTFIIEKGACFIDDQFIGFKDNVTIRFSQVEFLPNNEYWLVLQYNWLMQADYKLAHFEAIPKDLFNESEMLKIRGFKITTAGELELLPEDLNDQFAQNFHKIFDLSAEKVVDSIESMKFQYLVFEPEEEKIDPKCKSGDFVYMDYISGKYRPARSCTKRLDKAVGVYLKDITNNKDYIIHNGFVDFSNPRWNIHPKRVYLTTLEPGVEYYLADNCIIKDTANPFYNDTLQMKSIDPGKISTRFYPGLVRVGYAVGQSTIYINMDYSSEIDVNNILELFGDKERFDIRYQDYYKYYKLLEDQQFIIDYLTKNNSTISKLLKSIEDLENKINKKHKDFTDNLNDFNSKKNILNNKVSSFNIQKDLHDISMRYSYNIQRNFINKIYDEDYFDTLGKNISFYKEAILKCIDDLEKNVNNNKNLNYSASEDQKNTDGNILGVMIRNVKADLNKIVHIVTLLKNLINYDGKINDEEYDIHRIDSLKNEFNSYRNKSISTKTFSEYIDGFYIPKRDTGYLAKMIIELNDTIKKLNEDFKPISFYIFDSSNVSNFSYVIRIDKYQHTYYKIENDIDQNVIFNEVKLDSDMNNNPNTLQDGADKLPNSILNSISGVYNATQDINNYLKFEEYSDMRIIFEKANFISSKIYSYMELLKKLLPEVREKLDQYSETENIIDKNSSFINDINNNFNQYQNNVEDLTKSHQNSMVKEIKLFDYHKQKDLLNKFLARESNNNEKYTTLLNKIEHDITVYKQALGTDLDFNIPTKSIFMISNYQRILYNYTYITNRLKIKYRERKVIEDRIQISKNARTKVLSHVPVNKALDEQLQYIIASYRALENEINNEIKTLTEEYNKIRTTYLGTKPIINDNPNFDDGGYAIFDLDCLDTVE